MLTNQRRWNVNTRGGFTLIELIAVITIISVVMGIAVTRLDFLVPEYALRGAAREVGAILKQARTRAVGSGKDVYVEFDLARGDYWLLVPFPRPVEDGEPAGSLGWEYQPILRRALPKGVDFVDVVISTTERMDEGIPRVWVSPFGGSNHVIVNLQLRGEEAVKAVKMNGFTGHLSFADGYLDAKELLEDSGP